jgi:nucleoside-diphosphate kinase
MVKPDGVARGLSGSIMKRFEQRGFQLVNAKTMTIDQGLAEHHYAEHREKPFFGDLIAYITSGPVFAMVWEAENAVEIARSMMGATNPAKAAPGTIRGDYATSLDSNVIHGSDSPESAEREIRLFFGEELGRDEAAPLPKPNQFRVQADEPHHVH